MAPRSDFSSVSLKVRHSDLALINKLEQVRVSQKIYKLSNEHKGINTIFLGSSLRNRIISSLLFNKPTN